MDLKEIKNEVFKELSTVENTDDLENLRVKYLGRKGELTLVLRSLKDLPINQRKKIGSEANKLRNELENKIKEKVGELSAYGRPTAGWQNKKVDITAPGVKISQGHLHPITRVIQEIEEIFKTIGFEIIEGPDIETEYYNFDALNIPDNHPARDMWDTFWLKLADSKSHVANGTSQMANSRDRSNKQSATGNKLLLRTHTSPMQARYMEKNNPPFRIVVPGRVFRYEAQDVSHSHTFYQLEGLMVDKDINVANFKAVIEEFLKRLFSKDIKARLRPSYFPFVEPGFEVDLKGGQFKDWVEIMGAGMVHPNVFKAVGYNPANWQGFAFGIGLDRIANIKYGIDDIRLLYSGDLRFLNQF